MGGKRLGKEKFEDNRKRRNHPSGGAVAKMVMNFHDEDVRTKLIRQVVLL